MGFGHKMAPDIGTLKHQGKTSLLFLVPRHAFLLEKPMADDLFVISEINRQCNMHFRLPPLRLAMQLARNLPEGSAEFMHKYLHKADPFPADTAIAYVAPGEAFGKKITMNIRIAGTLMHSLDMPAYQHNAARDSALVVQGITLADFKQGKDERSYSLEVPEGRVAILNDFPRQEGYYWARNQLGLPSGKEAPNSVPGSCMLKRNEGTTIALVSFSPMVAETAIAAYWPRLQSNFVVEISEDDAKRMRAQGGIEYCIEGYKSQLLR